MWSQSADFKGSDYRKTYQRRGWITSRDANSCQWIISCIIDWSFVSSSQPFFSHKQDLWCSKEIVERPPCVSFHNKARKRRSELEIKLSRKKSSCFFSSLLPFRLPLFFAFFSFCYGLQVSPHTFQVVIASRKWDSVRHQEVSRKYLSRCCTQSPHLQHLCDKNMPRENRPQPVLDLPSSADLFDRVRKPS